MENKQLYAMTGVFDTPDDIRNAAESISDQGYTDFDVNTPYPVHGMDRAMKMKGSKLGYFALVLGLTGAATALLFMYFTVVVDYPLVIGGKPFWALPSFIPITFEVTVLMAAVGTVIAMIIFFFKFPNNAHPLHDTDYMKKVSSDKYGIAVLAEDPKFDENTVKNELQSLGAKDIEPIYLDIDEFTQKPELFDPKFIGFLVIIAGITAGASYFSMNKLVFLPPFDWMNEQPRFDVQSETDFFENKATMREPVEASISRGNMPYPYPDSIELAGQFMVNPLPMTEENMEAGREKYNTFCSPCHGNFGKGNGRLNDQFPTPPSMHTEKLRNWEDGKLYHVITVGQNVMPSYANLITPEERWQIVNYIRALQRALNANEEDLK